MKKTIFAVASLAILSACTPRNTYLINGILGEEIEGATSVFLINPEKGDTIATSDINNGAFTFEGIADEVKAVYAIVDRRHAAQIFLEPGNIEVNLAERSAKGTALNNEKNSLSKALKDAESEEAYTAILKEFYNRNKENVLGKDIWDDLSYELEYDEFVAELENASPAIKDNPRNQELISSKLAAKNTAAGAKFVDFKAVTVDIKNAKKDGVETSWEK